MRRGPAATINTKLTVTMRPYSRRECIVFRGPATLPNIGSGTIAAPSLTANAQGNYSGAFTITLTRRRAGTITGTLTIPVSVIAAAATGCQSVVRLTVIRRHVFR